MNRSTRRISMLLVLTMVLGLFAAFPVLNVAAADTNYASGLTATFTKDGAEGAIQGGVISALTDGTYPTAETAADSVWFAGTGAAFAFTFNLGSVKTDLSSVYAYVRVTGNRGFYAASTKVEISNDNVTYTNVAGTVAVADNATANYKDVQFNFSAVQSAQYVRLTLSSDQYILSLGEIEIRNYGLSTGGDVSVETADPTLVDGNYAYGATYTVTKNDAEPTYRNAQQTDGGNWLTDGYEGAAPSANGSAGYTVAYNGSSAAYVFTLNLTASKSDISSVTFVNVPAPGDSFKDPVNVAISTSTDGLTYTSVGTISTTSIEKNAGGAYDLTYGFSAKSGKYVQISLTSGGYLFGLDEIVIKGAGGAVVDPEPILTPSTEVKTSSTATNYALGSNGTGAYYKYSVVPTAEYTDDTWSRPSGLAAGKLGQGQLNDGKYAAGSYNDTEWVAWVAPATTIGSVELVFDLNGVYGDIDQIAFTTMAHGGDVTQYDSVSSISVSFGDYNGTYGAATSVTATVTETEVTAADGKAATYYRSQFGIKGAATGVRFVKIVIPKATYRLFIDEIEILGATGFEGTTAPTPDSSVADPSVDEPSVDDGSYVLDRDFKVDVSAAYGDYDTDGDGTNDFTGIAVDVAVNSITYDRGLLGIEGFLNFDNTKLQPLYVTDADLNGTALDNPPKTILNWPTFTLLGMNLYAIEGLCQSYSMADGSTTDPANPEATFSKNDSRMRIRYILHTDYYEGYTNGTSIGVKEDGAMALRYYFIVPEGSEGQTFTFTVPDTPKATHISECALYAPMSYLDGTTIKYSSVYGFGGSASVTIEEPVKEYTVTFVGKDGETLKEETVVEGGAATAPEAPVVEGFEFKGWDKAFDNITADTTVTAIYEEVIVEEPAEFFVFADSADTTYIKIDETNGYLKFSAGGLTVANVKALFVDTDITFTKSTGAAQTSGTVGTGATITSTINGETKSYTVVVLGDTTGDGRVNAGDYNKVVSAVNGKTTLEGAFFVAANVVTPNTARLAANDYAKIKSYISGKATNF